MEKLAEVVAHTVTVAPTSMVSLGALRHPAVLAGPDELISVVTRAIDGELPAALGIPGEAAEELARAALGAIVDRLHAQAALDVQAAP